MSMGQLQHEMRYGQHRVVYNSVCVYVITLSAGWTTRERGCQFCLWSRGLDSAVPSLLHTQAESGAHNMDYYLSFSSPDISAQSYVNQDT